LNPPSVSAEEGARIEALKRYRILDSEAEPAFDELATLAAQIFGCPLALITLVDRDRQWFKSAIGISLRETSREVSFCSHTLEESEVLVIPDMLADERFHDHPFVIGEPKIRFYAGAPLVTPEGQRIGALCVLDRVPREISRAQAQALQTLSRQVVSLLELRRRLLEEKELAEETLRENRQLFQALVEHSSDAIKVIDASGIVRYAGPTTGKVLGYSPEELVGRDGFELTHPDDLAVTRRVFEGLLESPGETVELEVRLKHKDGSWRRLECVATNLLQEKSVRGIVVNYRDITQRRRADDIQAALFRIAEKANTAEDLNEFFATIHEIVSGLIFGRNFYIAFYDPATDLISFPYFVDEFDKPPPPLHPGKGLTDFVLRTGKPLLADANTFQQMARQGYVELVGAPSLDWLGVPLTRGETVFGVLAVQSYTPEVRFGEAERDLLTYISRHIAGALERKRTEEEIRRSEEKFRTIFDYAPIGIYQSLPDGAILSANPALVRILGFRSVEELREHNMGEIYFHPEERNALLSRHAAQDVASDMEVLWKRKDGTPVWIQLTAQTIRDKNRGIRYYEGFARDITSQKSLEEQLRQSQKMEAVGRLAGGIAHDFNNLLTAVLGYSDIALSRVEPDDPLRPEIEEIRRAGQRAANLTGQLLAFSRKQVLVPEVLDLNSVIANLGTMLRRLIGEDIALEFWLDPALGRMRADVGQIEQVIVNLVVNAREAMPQGGRLTVRTTNADVGEDDVRVLGRFFKTGSYVRLVVQDSGIGMDEVTRSHIFEPFFTTKDRTKGTGLGLATVYGIIKQSEGYILVDSKPGSGATFQIFFPRIAGELAAPPSSPGRSAAPSGTETVLIVEDEEAVRGLARRILRQSGYSVLEAGGGEEAVEIAVRHEGPIDLLLSDVVMPGMGGPALAHKIRQLRPATRILLMSGYTDDAILHHGGLAGNLAFLAKPFTPDGLLRRVREVLKAPAPGAA
jgi:two-component system cell cycle sensor histidine kinase/response regulator CckA